MQFRYKHILHITKFKREKLVPGYGIDVASLNLTRQKPDVSQSGSFILKFYIELK